MVGGFHILLSEVTFLDLWTMSSCESFYQGYFCQSRTKVGGSKWTRYPCNINHKLCQLEIEGRTFYDLSPLTRNQSIWIPGRVWLQGWNLEELTEGHHQKWSLRVNLTQGGKSPRPNRIRIIGRGIFYRKNKTAYFEHVVYIESLQNFFLAGCGAKAEHQKIVLLREWWHTVLQSHLIHQ